MASAFECIATIHTPQSVLGFVLHMHSSTAADLCWNFRAG